MKGCWWLLPVLAASAWALPTMVRIGYPNCVSCHVSPQGGGLLNDYGRGIDDAQSLRAGEYAPGLAGPLRRFAWNGRADQDFRAVLSDSGDFRSRFYCRNVTSLGKGWRPTMTAAGEHAGSRTAYLPALMAQYRPREGMEFAAGRDHLPTGVYNGDFGTLLRARNRFGLYDTPTQAKLFLWGKRWQAVPYLFEGNGERGGGVLAEYDLLGRGRTVVGANLLRGAEKRRAVGWPVSTRDWASESGAF